MAVFAEPESVRAARRAASQLLVAPWFALGRVSGLTKTRALRRQVSAGHRMHGTRWFAIGALEGDDDAMFVSEAGEVAIVRLTYARPSDPGFPHASLYASVGEAVQSIASERAYVEALERAGPDLICVKCGADWKQDQGTAGCQVCDGYGLSRPCPVCAGACGAVWSRAVIDSNDAGHAIWIGSCRQTSAPAAPDG